MYSILHKDIFENIYQYLDKNDIKSLICLNKKLYLFFFNSERKFNLVFNYEILIQNLDIVENNNFSKKIISIIDPTEITLFIKHIYVNKYFDIKKIKNCYQIKTLIFANDFTSVIGKQYSFLPDNVKILIFGNDFNQNIGSKYGSFIPKNVEKIIFGEKFNRVLSKNNLQFIPDSVKTLIFGKKFNKNIYAANYDSPIMSLIPSNIETLIFGDNFNQDICIQSGIRYHYNLLPDKIKCLKFGSKFRKNISFTVYKKYPLRQIDTSFIPSSVIYLTIHHYYKKFSTIPDTVKIANFVDDNNKNIETIKRQL